MRNLLANVLILATKRAAFAAMSLRASVCRLPVWTIWLAASYLGAGDLIALSANVGHQRVAIERPGQTTPSGQGFTVNTGPEQ